MAHFLVTGGSGFLGSLLVRRLLGDGHTVTSIDLLPSNAEHPNLRAVVGDIRDRSRLSLLLPGIDTVFHCAALLAHGSLKPAELWSNNVDGTRALAQETVAAGVPKLVYISSNCLWGHGFDRPVREDDPPAPCEIYGASKWECEKVLSDYAKDLEVVILRSPTIVDEGRLGLLAILFEFIAEGRRVWMVGQGTNRYQFVYAQDLIEAMLMAWRRGATGTFGIGADDVGTMRETFEHVIARAGTGARTACMPLRPALFAMRVAHTLRISPLGPYHYRMIGSNFVFDTRRIKAALGWSPTLTNRDMLLSAYRYYATNRSEIAVRHGVSAHRRSADMGVIRVLKWIS
ncbi:NAD-dependent epimerase/dehydratase family protein [Methylobacterium sp. CM6257]